MTDSENIAPLRRTNFGWSIKVPMPSDCDVMVICADTNSGRKPVRILLTGQLYVHTAHRIAKEYGVKTLTVLPYRNIDKFEISVADLPQPPTDTEREEVMPNADLGNLSPAPDLSDADPSPVTDVSAQDPLVLLAGIKQFGLASDGADLRDLEAAIQRLLEERDIAQGNTDAAIEDYNDIKERVAVLEGALRPFADYADHAKLDLSCDGEIGEVYCSGLRRSIHFRALRNARAALNGEG